MEDTKPTEANATEAQTNVEQSVDKPTEPSTVERLLTESKKYKERAQRAESELEKQKKAALAEQGKYKELYEKMLSDHETLKKNVVVKEVSSAVARAASKAGCIDDTALLKLGDSALLQYDEESGQTLGIDGYIQAAKQKFPFLFSAHKSAMINPAVPNGQTTEKKLTAADIAKLPQDKKLELWKQAFKNKQ